MITDTTDAVKRQRKEISEEVVKNFMEWFKKVSVSHPFIGKRKETTAEKKAKIGKCG